MSFKSSVPPQCIYCGGPIRKHTNPVNWTADRCYRSVADVQRDHNQTVVHVRYGEVIEGTSYWAKAIEAGAKIGDRIVTDYSTWDGESYEDEFFCNGEHAKRFAYKIARKYFQKRGG